MSTRITEELFLELGELLNSNLDEVTILRTFCNKLLSLFAAERVSILGMGPFGKALTLKAWAGRYPDDISGLRMQVGEGVAGWVAATGESLLVTDVDSDPRFSDRLPDRYKTGSFISVPLKSRGRILGVLNVADSTRTNKGFTASNLKTLKTLALQVGMGLENIRMRERLTFFYDTTSSFIPTLQELQTSSMDIESELIPTAINGLFGALGPHAHVLLLGEMGINRAWLGLLTSGEPSQINVMDFSSGFSLYQSLAALPINPPYPEKPKLEELGFPWPMVMDEELRLIRSLLPPRHNMFGMALSAVPARAPEALELLQVSQNVMVQFTSLLIEGVFDRQQIQKLDQLKTELISTVSHELRTPLTSIQGFSELVLRDSAVKDRHGKYLGIINRESKRLNRLINNFLDLARLESGQLTLIKEPIEVVDLVESAVKLLKPQAEERKAMVRLQSDRSMPPLIGDRDRVEQAIVNLVGNAIKYGGEGVHIDIHLHTTGSQTILEVIDDGEGIPTDELPLVFNRFYRGARYGEVEDEELKGTGLGLSLTREIVEQHGGTISVESVPAEKTIFRVTLPTAGLITPAQEIAAWHPGDEMLPTEISNRLAEGKTVGLLTMHIRNSAEDQEGQDHTVESIGEMEELIISSLKQQGMEDDYIQSRPHGEFFILTYASLVDDYADTLTNAFENRFDGAYNLAMGAAVAESDEEVTPDKLFTLSRQACEYVERTLGKGYLKNRRM
jgi:signal transduction histidine kinase/putative methionine-R-sulfoxide reductase with GAF domain